MPEFLMSLGAEPSKQDLRTIQHSDLALAFPPPAKHAKTYKRPHKHQRKLGICTGAAVADAVEQYYYAWALEKGLIPEDWEGSMGWLYKIGKVFIDANTSEGSSIFTMLKAAQKFGIPSEKKFPTDYTQTYSNFIKDLNITQAMLDDAGKHKIPGYAQVSLDQSSLIRAIYESKVGILVRMDVGDNWYTDTQGKITWDKNKLEPLRKLSNFQSGHAVKFIGYDTVSDFKLTTRNSWSIEYCNSGNIDLFRKDHQSDITEAWIIVDKILFILDLRMGSTGESVKRLQQFLNKNGFIISQTGNGSPGNETEYFGLLTFNAVKKFQKANGLPDTGFFGPMTRTIINKML